MNKLSIGDVCLYEDTRECVIKSIVLTDNGGGDDRLVAMIYAQDLTTNRWIAATSDKFKIKPKHEYCQTRRMLELEVTCLLTYNTIRIDSESGFDYVSLYDSVSKRLMIKLDSVLHTFYNVVEYYIVPTKTALGLTFDNDALILWEQSKQE